MPAFLVTLASSAFAQDWSDLDWYAFPCDTPVMTDPWHDESGAEGERDIVGDEATPAGFRAVDDAFVYFRMRVDTDPVHSDNTRPFSWGILLDSDGDRSTYEAMVLADGVSEEVRMYPNTVTESPDDPTEPPDDDPLVTATLADRTRGWSTNDSQFGDDDDYYYSIAIRWDELALVGIGRKTVVAAWYGTSSSKNTSLNGDFACHDGSSGDPKSLTGTSSSDGGTPLDPTAVDTDGDGFPDIDEEDAGTDPSDPVDFPSSGDGDGAGDDALDGTLLEGAGGLECGVLSPAAVPRGAVLLLAALFLRRRPLRGRAST